MEKKQYPERGTPEWHQLQVAKKTLKTRPEMLDILGGMTQEEAEELLQQYGVEESETSGDKYYNRALKEVSDEPEMADRTTVRLVNRIGESGGEWFVSPDELKSKKMQYIFDTLKEYQKEEADSGWKLQTRGTHTMWHDWDLQELKEWADKNEVMSFFDIEHFAEGDPKKIAKRVSNLLNAQNTSDVDAVMDELNELLQGYGIEAIRGEEGDLDSSDYGWDGYWTDIVALYINMGDTYSPTVVYDRGEDRYVMTSWGDWVEDFENRGGQIY